MNEVCLFFINIKQLIGSRIAETGLEPHLVRGKQRETVQREINS